MSTVLPTVGRIVLYRLSKYDSDGINLRYPVELRTAGLSRNPVYEGYVLPALVVASWGGSTVNLRVFLDGEPDYWATSRVEGEDPGQWFWPPRV